MKDLFAHLTFIFLFCFGAVAQNNVTFQLDMNSVDPTTFTTPEVNGTFNSWCGSCASMTDIDGDNVWDIVIDLANGTYEFKFSADSWGIQETLFSGESCTNGNSQFTNRMLTVAGDTTLPVVCWGSCSNCSSGPPAYNVTFELDMRGATDPYNNPEVNGDFNTWCGNCWQMSDSDGDSIWDFSALFAAGDTIEWKYSADNWSIQEDLDSNLSCITINYDPGAPNGYGFVNRLSVISSDTTFSSPWNECYLLGGGTGQPLSQIDLPITCDDTTVDYTVTDFGGNSSSLSVDPSDPSNNVIISDKTSGAQTWAGTTLGSPELLSSLPFVSGFTTISAHVYSPSAGTVVRMKAEDHTDPTKSVETEATTTIANGWNILVFNFANEAPGTAMIDFSYNYDMLSIFYDFGNGGLGDVYYLDNVVFGGLVSGIPGCTDSLACNYDPLATADDGSCLTLFGCTDSLACNFDPLATCDDGGCLTIYGCMNPIALNYDSLANCPDSCTTPSTSSLISACGDFDSGPTAWPYVLTATTFADGVSSQAAQTFTMNVTDISGGANFRVVKTTANGNFFFGPAVALTLGSNSITVAAVTFDRTVKFQFSNGDVEFDFLSLNGDTSDCVAIAGCTDSTALNFNSLAIINDSSCLYCYFGCMDVLACNYDSLATCDDGSCLTVYGCTDTLACNFDPLANCDDGSCLNVYGCTDSLANNYNPLATCDDSTCVYGYSVTFQLDLRGITNITYTNPEVNGMFNGWCGNCAQLEDLNNDSIWEITILIDSGSYEYKYSVDNWAIEENLFSGDSCTVSSNGFTNRILHVHQDTILDPVCWESCENCLSGSGPSSYNVTFRLDMSEYVGPPFTTPEVNGTFNSWCGSCWAMTDDNGDNVWEFTELLPAGDTVEYKFSADSWTIQEDLDSTGNCVTVAFDPGAPNGWGYVNRYLVVGSEIELDAVCWNSCAECQGQTGVSEHKLKDVFIYPNPSSGLININTPQETSRIDVFSVLGKLVYSKVNKPNKTEHTIDIKENGIYYISVYVGNEVVSKKITIQN